MSYGFESLLNFLMTRNCAIITLPFPLGFLNAGSDVRDDGSPGSVCCGSDMVNWLSFCSNNSRFDCWEKGSAAKSSGLGSWSTAEQILS